jgi:ribonuclease G
LPEWLIERGIGEDRAVRIKDGEIVQARILLEGIARAGSVVRARLAKGGIPAIAESDGQAFLLPKGAPGITEGATLSIEITREKIPGAEPWKRPLARLASDQVNQQPLRAQELPYPEPTDVLGRAGWDDLIDEARSGVVRFGGGELRVSPTPAMTLIDVDGTLPAAELAMAGARAAARTILRHDIGGSIGIDLPTLAGKLQRKAIGEAVDAILPQPFERTAVNGFGFLQIVRPRRRASLFELASDRATFEARVLLRRVALDPPGTKRIVAHPSVAAVLERRSDWLARLERQIGGKVALRTEPSLPIHGGYAENS